MKKLCALVVGHEESFGGAINSGAHIDEYEFNNKLAPKIVEKVKDVEIQIIHRNPANDPNLDGNAVLPEKINALNPNFIIELHCNACDTHASGTEVLYYYGSDKGLRMANVLLEHLVTCLGLPNRGTQYKVRGDRGYHILEATYAPCVISEPFFIDNDHDFAIAMTDIDDLASAYAGAIERIAKTI